MTESIETKNENSQVPITGAELLVKLPDNDCYC